ncbi:MAG: HlyC/CorC family transporter [Deltaproteobacteria bacterium]|nr:HlyC/CorC family transporter [Deltaproteobacteria bacterium]
MTWEWSGSKALAVAALLFISAFAASSETSLFSLNRFQLRRLRDRYRAAYARISSLLAHPGRLLVLILVINEIVNIAISSLITEMVHANRGLLTALLPWPSGEVTSNEEWLITSVISIAISLPLVLLFGDITPKVTATKINKLVAMTNSKILVPLSILLRPLLVFVDSTINFSLRGIKAKGRDPLSKTLSTLSEEDFVVLMEEGHREGTVNQDERELITNVLEFDDSTVAEVMTPVAEAFCLPDDAKLWNVLPDIRAQKYSRVAVYHKSRRNIVGILYVKSLLKLQNNAQLREMPVKELMAPALYVKPEMHLSALFKKLKTAKTHIAVCTDRHGEALGLATMEDVLESIFGDIEDERDVR